VALDARAKILHPVVNARDLARDARATCHASAKPCSLSYYCADSRTIARSAHATLC